MLSKVIAISQQKVGVEKTTLAVHLALAFIKYHYFKVAVIDTDPQGSLGKWFIVRSENKVSNENLTFKTAIEKQRKGNAVEEIKKLSEQILNELKQ